MRRSFVVLFAACSALSVAAHAQTADQADGASEVVASQPEAQAKPKMVKKRVCTKFEAVTGSRTNGRSHNCKTVEVPADASTDNDKRHEDHKNAGASN